MYWKDSINVLEDLDQFESLYIRYHHCVWSKYGTRYGTGEDYDNQDDDNNNFENGCGGFGGGEYYWYMGRTQCFKANVAYSLYGVLKGDDPKKKRGSYCHSDSYINSFFTTFGTESFAGPMGLGTNTANSVCRSDQQNGGGNGDFSYAQVDDDYLGDDYNFYDAESYVSQGTGCSADGRFVKDQYSGPFCHGKDYESTLDDMEDFNAALQEMDCTEIYSASNNNNDGEDRNRNRNRELEDEEYDFDYDFEDLPAYQILAFSKSCSVAQYPHDCPDPYGHKRKYSQKIQRALAYKTGRYRDMGANFVRALSWIFFATGVCFLGAIYYLNQQQDKTNRKAERRRRRELRKQQKRNNSTSYDDDDDISTVLERGIESTISNVSGASSKSKKSAGTRSCLGLPKIKLPKKLRRGKNGSGSARDDDEITHTLSSTMGGFEMDEGGEIVEFSDIKRRMSGDTNSYSAPWMDGYSVADTSLAESQIYMTEKEEGIRATVTNTTQGSQKEEQESQKYLPGSFSIGGAIPAMGTLTTTTTNDATGTSMEDQAVAPLTTYTTNVSATDEELLGIAPAGSSVSGSSAPLGIAGSSMSAQSIASRKAAEQELRAIAAAGTAAAAAAAVVAMSNPSVSSVGTPVEQELQSRSNSVEGNYDKNRSLGMAASSVSASSSKAAQAPVKQGSDSMEGNNRSMGIAAGAAAVGIAAGAATAAASVSASSSAAEASVKQGSNSMDGNHGKNRQGQSQGQDHLESAPSSPSPAVLEYTAEVQVYDDNEEGINPFGSHGRSTQGPPIEDQDRTNNGIGSRSKSNIEEEASTKGKGGASNGYITLEDLLDEAGSFVSHTSVGSWGEDYFSSAFGKKNTNTELLVSRTTSAEWGVPPVKDEDESTTSGASNRGMTEAAAATAAVAGTAALVAAGSAAAASSPTKTKSKIPSRLRGLLPLSPSRKAEIAKTKLKKLKEGEVSVKQLANQEDPTVPPPLPVPVTPVASGEDPFSDILADTGDMPNDPSKEESNISLKPTLPLTYCSDDDYDLDQSELDPAEQVEICLEQYEIYSDNEDENAEEEVQEEEEEEAAVNKGEDDLAEPPRQSPKKRKKGFFRRNPKSPENSKTLRGLFGKPPKTLSPTQMATAPPLVFVSPPSTKKKNRRLRSKSPLQTRFFSKNTRKQKLKKQSVPEETQQQEPPVVGNEGEEEQEKELNINAATSASFDLVHMIDIIEPVIPPESQKDLFSATPPVSQKNVLGNSPTSVPKE